MSLVRQALVVEGPSQIGWRDWGSALVNPNSTSFVEAVDWRVLRA